MTDARIGPPERLSHDHDATSFASGEPALDEWLRRRALQNDACATSRTYVVCIDRRVVGFYTFSTGAIDHIRAPGRIRRNMPDPVPVIVLGRLAADRGFHARGLGTALLRDAVLRTLQVAEIAGVRAMLVHTISEAAKRFYEKYGFVASPVDPMTVMITTAEAARMADRG